jgi:excisionase family DNA binding protein
MVATLTRLKVQDAEREAAREGASLLERTSGLSHGGLFVTESNGEQVLAKMPVALLAVMRNILAALAENGETLLLKSEAEISPENAAEILGISRPLVYQRMDAGRLPFRQVGTHRRIRAAEVAALRQFEDRRRSFAAALSADTEDPEENHVSRRRSATVWRFGAFATQSTVAGHRTPSMDAQARRMG